MAKMKGQDDIEDFVISLAEFFRISLHKGEKFIPVREELELIKHYLIIEDARFPGEIEVTYDIDEETLEYPTLKLILQPIIENAIKHGLSESEKDSKLIIKVEQTDTDIIYTIKDNGVGFELPTDLLHRSSTDIKKGYGLQNVNDRIRLEYGEGYGIDIQSESGVGTTVTIRIKKP
jgi:two-component system sensor histidine kinase YesM